MGKAIEKVNPERKRVRHSKEFKLEAVRLLELGQKPATQLEGKRGQARYIFNLRRNDMAFVNEKYPQEEKARIDALVESRPPHSRSPGLSSWWTVDRDRNACLVIVGKEGGSYEGTPETRHYALISGEHEIRFSGEYHVTGDLEKGELQIVTWHIHSVSIPDVLIPKKDEVLALVQEALDAQGLHNNRRCVASVVVNFDLE